MPRHYSRKKKTYVPLEGEVVRACLDTLYTLGIYCWRQNQGGIPLEDGGFRSFNGMRGLSDIIGILKDGRFLAVEVKRPGKTATEEQWQFIESIQKNGGVSMVVSSVDELLADLKTFGVVK